MTTPQLPEGMTTLSPHLVCDGATDAIGLKAIEKPMHFRDLHTTILYNLGLNQDALSYMHLGRKERLTEVRGNIVKDILA